MKVFWEEGYEAASVDTLCRKMGMPRASLYQTFGDKEGLFLAAIGHYADSRIEPLVATLGPKGTLREDLSAFFDAVVALATAEEKTKGCLISSVLSDAAGSNPRLRAELDLRFGALENKLAERLEVDAAALTAPAEGLAKVLAAIARGLMLRARSGVDAKELRNTAAIALETLLPQTAA
mgnify:CR=1 FL=1